MKKFILTVTEEEKDGKSTVKYDAQNDGFTSLEIIGILSWKSNDIANSLKPIKAKTERKEKE